MVAPLLAPDSAPKAERPWAANVAEDAQKQAMQLFEEGNKLFEDSQHAAALAKYREALKVWDHPAIRYNAAVALINLDRPARRLREPGVGAQIWGCAARTRDVRTGAHLPKAVAGPARRAKGHLRRAGRRGDA